MNPYGVSSLIGTAIALPILSILAVILRFYVRLRMRRANVGIDDWLILSSVILVVGQAVIQILSALYGAGDGSMKPSEKGRIAYQQKLSRAVVVVEKATYTLIKLSVLFLYRRIFSANPSFRRVNTGLILLIIIWGLFFLFLESFVCVSVSTSSLSCPAQEWTLLWFGITEVLGDIAILSLPYPCIRKLQKKRRDQIGLAATFGLGALSIFFGIIRLGYVGKTFHAYFHPEVKNHTGPAPAFWTTVEVSFGVVAACLPPLRPLVMAFPGREDFYSSIKYALCIRLRSKQDTQRGEGWDIQEHRVEGTYIPM